jgi:hypothetical protein
VRPNLFISVLAGAVIFTAPVFAHRLHAGVTEVTINSSTNEMEIVHRLFADDLLVAIGRDNVHEAEFFATAEGVEEVGAYVTPLFRFADNTGLLFDLTYIGAEMDGEFAWIYFTADVPEIGNGFIVDNDLLAEQFDDQSMMTNLHFDSAVRTAFQGPGRRDPIRLSFD